MDILILFASTEGHTRKIGHYMADHLTALGHVVTVSDISNRPPALHAFDLVMLGGSLHVLKHQVLLSNYARAHAITLNRKNSVFFPIGLGPASQDERATTEFKRAVGAFLDRSGWNPERVELMAGALKYDEGDLFKQRVIDRLNNGPGRIQDPSGSYEFTDWERITAFCNELHADHSTPSIAKPGIPRPDKHVPVTNSKNVRSLRKKIQRPIRRQFHH